MDYNNPAKEDIDKARKLLGTLMCLQSFAGTYIGEKDITGCGLWMIFTTNLEMAMNVKVINEPNFTKSADIRMFRDLMYCCIDLQQYVISDHGENEFLWKIFKAKLESTMDIKIITKE